MKNVSFFRLFLPNFLFCFFPISLVIGNQATNLNTIFLAIIVLIFYKKEITNLQVLVFDKILIFFFCYILVSLIKNFFEYKLYDENFNFIILIKTLLFFKYLILYFIIRFLISENIIKIKIFYIICAIAVTVVSFDIIFQFIFGKNILGIATESTRHFSGFFGEELIAGGYIQKFSWFAIFSPYLFLKKKKYKFLISIIFFLIFLLTIILSGNRMPLILFLFSLLVPIILIDKFKKYFLKVFLTLFLFLLILYYVFPTFQTNINNFKSKGINLISTIIISNFGSSPEKIKSGYYIGEFFCGRLAIELNPFFGGGIRSSRLNSNGCGTHPHNYFIEIGAELGLLGVLIIIFFSYGLFYKVLRKYYLYPKHYKPIKVMPIFLILLAEFFPFRSSGSFFSTNNATIIFIMLAVLISFLYKNDLKS